MVFRQRWSLTRRGLKHNLECSSTNFGWKWMEKMLLIPHLIPQETPVRGVNQTLVLFPYTSRNLWEGKGVRMGGTKFDKETKKSHLPRLLDGTGWNMVLFPCHTTGSWAGAGDRWNKCFNFHIIHVQRHSGRVTVDKWTKCFSFHTIIIPPQISKFWYYTKLLLFHSLNTQSIYTIFLQVFI